MFMSFILFIYVFYSTAKKMGGGKGDGGETEEKKKKVKQAKVLDSKSSQNLGKYFFPIVLM